MVGPVVASLPVLAAGLSHIRSRCKHARQSRYEPHNNRRTHADSDVRMTTRLSRAGYREVVPTSDHQPATGPLGRLESSGSNRSSAKVSEQCTPSGRRLPHSCHAGGVTPLLTCGVTRRTRSRSRRSDAPSADPGERRRTEKVQVSILAPFRLTVAREDSLRGCGAGPVWSRPAWAWSMGLVLSGRTPDSSVVPVSL